MAGRGQTVRGSVEQGSRKKELALADRKAVDQQVRGSAGYFGAIVPAHIKAEQFVAIVLGQLHKSEDLARAAFENTPSLLAALADCARLGLVPGDGYALVPFWNDKLKRMEVVGITEYTGELELIYRTGLVATVIAKVVHENDTYLSPDHPHEAPVFRRGPGRFPSPTARGEAIGAFGYVVFRDGTIGVPVEMSRDEIMAHRDVAKTHKIWDGPFWASMWLKTIVHELFKWTPKSAEYVLDAMRANAAMIDTPGAPDMSALASPSSFDIPSPGIDGAAQAITPAAAPDGPPPGRQQAPEHQQRRRGRTPEPAATPPPGPGKPAPAALVNRIGVMLDEARIDPAQQLGVVKALAGDWDIDDLGEHPISAAQAHSVVAILGAAVDDATDERPARAIIGELVAAAAAAKFAAEGGEPPQ